MGDYVLKFCANVPNKTPRYTKHGGGSCMGAFSGSGIGPLHRVNGIMDKHVYKDILQNQMLTHLRAMGRLVQEPSGQCHGVAKSISGPEPDRTSLGRVGATLCQQKSQELQREVCSTAV
ncbi:unnamed protein product [Caenorhabditis auriculariae]|uniref:Uncharacterized protein n=1 Tax=Caenorhabditis auriculariae TaxID=2777116 RepID=A0A8S1HWA7_9PELO|nr:unnamed protein product [Caenorhabditis auriculariae]